jgi:hypothetical protein
MLHSLLFYNSELNIIRAGLRKLDINADTDKSLRAIKTLDAPALLKKLEGIGGSRCIFNTEELEMIASALVYIGDENFSERDQEKYRSLCRTIGEHLGRRFY